MKTFRELEIGDIVYYKSPDNNLFIWKIIESQVTSYGIRYELEMIIGCSEFSFNSSMHVADEALNKYSFITSRYCIFTDEKQFLEYINENI